jgi:hypothetical protein
MRLPHGPKKSLVQPVQPLYDGSGALDRQSSTPGFDLQATGFKYAAEHHLAPTLGNFDEATGPNHLTVKERHIDIAFAVELAKA